MPPKNYRNSSRRSRWPRLLIGGFGLVILMAIGIVGTLWLAGVPLNPFAQSEAVDDPFLVRIPINSRPVPAYSRVDRMQLVNLETGGIMIQKIPPPATVGMSIVGVDDAGSHVESRIESVKNVNDEVVFVGTGGVEVKQSKVFTLGGAILNVNAIIGRVVKRDKRVGLGFQESSFFPKGTPEGLVGATPKGMRAITLNATKLTGVHSLGAGDQIDLLANVPSDQEGAASKVELIAQKAKVLRPVFVRNEVSTSATLIQGNQTTNSPKYEVALAVNAEDVIPLQNAINDELSITCVAHSMKPAVEGEVDGIVKRNDAVSVPVTVRPILAYNVVSRDAFVSQATRSLKSETISRQEADRIGAITSLSNALGAIVRQDIPAGRYLRRADLLNGPPTKNNNRDSTGFDASSDKRSIRRNRTQYVSMRQEIADEPQAPTATAVGDRPTITRFIPAGRTAFAIPLNRIYGGEHLQIGDSIDLMASYSLERMGDEEETETRPDGTVVVRKSEALSPRTTQRNWEESFGNRAEPWFVASDAIVVAPVGYPAPAPALRALADPSAAAGNNNRRPNSFDGPPVIIAVDDQDVEAVAAALATRNALFSGAIHSANDTQEYQGRDDNETKRIVVAPEPIAAFTTVSESTWQGNRRRMLTRTVSASDPRYAEALSELSMRNYYGRVLASDKARGEPLTAADFLPKGTNAGIAASGRVGFSLLPIADREIEGLDAFETNDRVAILIRGEFQLRNSSTRAALGFQPAVASVVSQGTRIAKSSVAGQTILEVSNRELAALQVALARSLSNRESSDQRSSLVAVGLHRRSARDMQTSEATTASEIDSLDPLTGVQATEVIVGSRRSVQVFFGGDGA